MIDSKGRCCGRKPLVYKRDLHLYCPRCDRGYNPKTLVQIENWAYEKDSSGIFIRKQPNT